jgi:phosphoribosylanthranilate isomerase
MLVKICGMKESGNIQAICEHNPDMMGFIFYKKSARYVGDDFDAGQLDELSETLSRVAVFVNESIDVIDEISAIGGFEYVQLHGDESPEYCNGLNKLGVKVIKAFSVNDDFDFELLRSYTPFCDYFLFDTKGAKRGGNGYSFDWNILRKYTLATPFILSGGLGVENICDATKLSFPALAGFDINSKIELAPGLKSVEQAEVIIKTIKNIQK